MEERIINTSKFWKRMGFTETASLEMVKLGQIYGDDWDSIIKDIKQGSYNTQLKMGMLSCISRIVTF
ncbi:MAG TPA: hypothetical protein VI564_03005 [Candidatus Nanoarchaeia archaeon]|nr:hypothetical protein [Candidatus Nanoarchaeia archaeon]